MSGLFVSQPPFPFQVWPDSKRNQDSADRSGELLRPLTQLMLLSTSPRKDLLACPSFPAWNLPSFIVEFILASPNFRSDSSLSRQDAALAHLDSLPPYNLALWTDGPVPFPFGKGGSGVLANCSLALRSLFPFQQAQYAEVFPLKLAPFCTLLAGLGSTNKSATSLLLLSESRSVLFSIFPFTSIFVIDLAGTVFSLLLYYQATMCPRMLVSPRE